MPTTPVLGLPYPDPTAPVSEGANDIKALAQKVETELGAYPRLLAEAVRAAPLLIPGAPGGDLLSVNVLTTTTPILIVCVGTVSNAGSGAVRDATLLVTVDGVTLGQSVTYTLPIGPGGNVGVGFAYAFRFTPTAGTHAIKLRGSASAVSATQIQNARLSVETQTALQAQMVLLPAALDETKEDA